MLRASSVILLLIALQLYFLGKFQNLFIAHDVLQRSGELHVRTLEEPMGYGRYKPKSAMGQTSRPVDSCTSRIVVCILQNAHDWKCDNMNLAVRPGVPPREDACRFSTCTK